MYTNSGTICEVSGAAASVQSCFFKIAAASNTEPLATALQFNMIYDNTKVGLTGFFDNVCFGPGGTAPCFVVAVAGPGSFPMSTGHSITLNPSAPASWAGMGGVVIVNVSKPDSALTPAYLNGNTVVGNPDFVEVRFTLKTAIPAGAPVAINLDKVLASDKTPKTQDTVVNTDLKIIVTKAL